VGLLILNSILSEASRVARANASSRLFARIEVVTCTD
jgi:hypothetical protein